MRIHKKNKKLGLARIFGLIMFASLMTGLIVFAMYYDPGKQYSNSFFDDVSQAAKWKN